MRSLKYVFIALAIAIASPAFATGSKEAPSGKPVIMVSILPQAYFVERIAGDRFKAAVLVGAGQSPHAYEPTPHQMADLSAAAAWLTIGAEFEKGFRPKVAELYKKLPIVDTTAGIQYRQLEAHHHEGETEAEHDEHDESGLDTHVWLGRQAVKAMAVNIRDALSSIDPAGKAAYAANHDALIRDVDRTYDGMVKDLASLRGTTAFVFHPAFGYLLDELGMEQEAVEAGGKEPTQKALAALIAEAKADGAKVVFVQAQFPTSAAKAVADAIGGAVVPIDPLARDWLDNLVRIGESLKKAAR